MFKLITILAYKYYEKSAIFHDFCTDLSLKLNLCLMTRNVKNTNISKAFVGQFFCAPLVAENKKKKKFV